VLLLLVLLLLLLVLRAKMDPLIGILVTIYLVLGFCIAYSTSVEITMDGPLVMLLIIGASCRRRWRRCSLFRLSPPRVGWPLNRNHPRCAQPQSWWGSSSCCFGRYDSSR
jgi:hypothetical protein